jgi:DNA-binding MarR family transcriptional regulator
MIADSMLEIFHRTTVAMVREEGRDLTARQLAVFLTCYLSEKKLAPKVLATDLKLNRAKVSAIVDRLERLSLVQRDPDPSDGRSVLIARTKKGTKFLRDLIAILAQARAETL